VKCITPKKIRSRAGVWWALILLLLLAYVLSIGPVYAHSFHASGDVGDEAAELLHTYYVPVVWLCRHSEPAHKAFTWYLRWCCNR
jgi:hypothetical protein